MKYEITVSSENGACELTKEAVIFRADGDYEEAFFKVDITFLEWEDDCYIMMPACAYNGNRFKRVAKAYPPMYLPEEAGEHCEPLITDVPALNPDGSGCIQVTSGDMAVPCVGIFNRRKKQGFFIFTNQEVKGKNIGFSLESGKLVISYPAKRTDIYRFCQPHDTSGDTGICVGAGEEISSAYKIYTFPADSMADFYEEFFEVRKSVMSNERAEFMYTKELWDIMETHFNAVNWSGEYYAEISGIWQCGWCGGGMSTYPLLKYGNDLSKERSRKTLDFLAKYQAPGGLYYSVVKDKIISGDGFGVEGMEKVHLIRKSGDALYFLLKQFEIEKPEQKWINSAKKCADALVLLFEKYGTFGQLVDIETGEIVVGGSCSGAIIPAALIRAWGFFGEEKYIDTAKASLEQYMRLFEETGVTNAGPGDILSAPDSESAFALLESAVVMYETDKSEKWLEFAKLLAHYCSSWVVTYSYKFPKGCEFERLRINTVGSVFANVQNKHSAPGICTLSGDSILKLYRFTKNEKYLELIKDIAYFIPQCVSTEKRPIYTWDNPPKKQPEGFISERVNMSDWEGTNALGGTFYGSCWCETSLMLSFAELMTCDEMLPEW